MSKIWLWLILGVGASILVGCASVPNPQLSLNVAKETAPIMLTKIESMGVTKKFDLSAGVSSMLMTSSRSNGGMTITQSMSESHNNDKPLDVQLHNLFIQDPPWLAVSEMSFTYNGYELMLAGSYSTKKMTTALTVEAPVNGAKQ